MDELFKKGSVPPINDMKPKDYYWSAVEDVYNEVMRAKSMFANDFVNAHEGYAVILEELDELWQEVKKNQRNYDIQAQRKEATQCAAMLVRFITELTIKPLIP